MTFIYLIKLSRPKQWLKNIFVFTGVIFSGLLFQWESLSAAIMTFAYFCIVSSTVYVVNDVLDIEKDKLHPVKKSRPLPAGLITTKMAFTWFLFLSILLCTGFLWVPEIMLILVLYFLVNVVYSLYLKHFVIIDIFTIALGFVLRVLAGTEAIGVQPSPWLLLCTLLLSLFLALGKRHNEMVVLEEAVVSRHRRNLREYSICLIQQWMGVTTSALIMAYSLYTFSAFEHMRMMITIPFVIYGLFRYQYLIAKRQLGGSPELILFSDQPFLVNTLLWGIAVLTIFYWI